jgi:hypothetical protein
MKDSEAKAPKRPLPPTARTERLWLIAGAFFCMLFGGFMAWGIHALWQFDDTRITSTFKEQMMHRKSQTMANILDGLVRSNMRSVEKSAEHMKFIGVHLDWYSSSELYENNDERFRQSVLDLIEAANQRDHEAAKESALRLERSCIECHALINRENSRAP